MKMLLAGQEWGYQGRGLGNCLVDLLGRRGFLDMREESVLLA